jgi:hypothetical protein
MMFFDFFFPLNHCVFKKTNLKKCLNCLGIYPKIRIFKKNKSDCNFKLIFLLISLGIPKTKEI